MPHSDYLWSSERWRLTAFDEPSGLPVIVLLEPREHYAGPADLPDDVAREQGQMLGGVEWAVLAVDTVARVHMVVGARVPSTCTGGPIGRPRGFGQLAWSGR
jgi:hypothetical protein